MKAVLDRLESSDQGTFGRITFGDTTLFTGELPEKDNASNASCIPAGKYKCVWTYSPVFKRQMYLVESVPGRSGIRIHSANFMGDKSCGMKCQLHGCWHSSVQYLAAVLLVCLAWAFNGSLIF